MSDAARFDQDDDPNSESARAVLRDLSDEELSAFVRMGARYRKNRFVRFYEMTGVWGVVRLIAGLIFCVGGAIFFGILDRSVTLPILLVTVCAISWLLREAVYDYSGATAMYLRLGFAAIVLYAIFRRNVPVLQTPWAFAAFYALLTFQFAAWFWLMSHAGFIPKRYKAAELDTL